MDTQDTPAFQVCWEIIKKGRQGPLGGSFMKLKERNINKMAKIHSSHLTGF